MEEIVQNSDEFRIQVEKFNKWLDKKPSQDKLKKNPYANNALYIPIEHLENKMQEVFMGLFEIEAVGDGAKLMGNAVVYDVHVKFFHPIAKVWLKRLGTGAAPIQLDRETKMPKEKGLVTAVGVAKSTAVKNACKSIGRMFGRDLNRKSEEVYEMVHTKSILKKIVQPQSEPAEVIPNSLTVNR